MERKEQGAPKSRAREALEGLAGLVVLVAIGAGVWSYFSDREPEPAATATATTPSTTRQPGHHVLREASFGCLSLEAYREAADYWINSDHDLFKGMFSSGDCAVLRKGEEVVLVDVKMMDYAVVRRPGTRDRLFTSGAALD